MKIQPFRSTSEVPTQIPGLPTLTEILFTTGQKSMGESQCRNSRQTSGLPTVGTPDDRRDFRRGQLIKQPAQLRPGLPAKVGSVSELPANVGTSDVHRQRAVRSTGAGTLGKGRDFRLSGVPTYVGTSDTESHRKNILCAREVLE